MLARQLVNCTTVPHCTALWSLLTMFHAMANRKKKTVWLSLWHHLGNRLMSLRRSELSSERLRIRGRLSEASDSVLLLAAHAPSYFQRPDVVPFLRPLECYAKQQNMRFTLRAGPWPLVHENVAKIELAWNFDQFLSTERPMGSAEFSNEEQQYVNILLDDIIIKRRLGRVSELPSFEFLKAYHDDPKLMVKIWAIEEELANESVDLVIYLDADVTLHPDAPPLVSLLTGGEKSGHIFVRDSFPGTECVNTGFIGFRNTEAAKDLLRLWKQKSNWSMFWDQNSFAESILELVGMEMEQLKRPGYNSQCVRYMIPMLLGVLPNTMYCDCWQAKLAEMIGPYRQRNSSIVSFVDPENVDVNFVPNDIFWNHDLNLRHMYLDQRRQQLMNPLIIHWAGLRQKRVRLARRYLKERFNTSFSEGTCRQPKAPAVVSFASNARYIKCCKSLSRQLLLRGAVEPREICYWSCCEEPPLNLTDCAKYH